MHPRETDPTWAEITAAAMAQKTADLLALEKAPLPFGQPIAWSTHGIVGNVTDGLSSVHRVGLPIGNAAYTTCGMPIPEPARWLSLSPALIAALAPCGFCEAAHADQQRGVAA